MSDYWMSGVVEADAEEARCADRFDTRWLQRIGTERVDVDDIPDRSDLPIEDFR